MSSQGSTGEKTEKPTQRRIDDARKKGTVAKSTDLVGSTVLLAMIAMAPKIFQTFSGSMMLNINSILARSPSSALDGDLQRYAFALFTPALMAFLGIGLTGMVVGLGINFVQVGFHFSTEAISPSLDKINPASGLKRIFSKRSLFEGFKAFLKGVLFGAIAWQCINSSWPQIITLAWQTPVRASGIVGGLIGTIAVRIGALWFIMSVVDFAFQKKQVMKQLMMTKDELKREYKEQEGSPEVKAARMQRMRKLTRGRMMSAVPLADVVITNPTHYAIAIKYDREKMHAPMIVAKGADYLALRIRELATENKVPIIPNPPLARALYKKCEVGDFVPREMFAAVAEVLAYVYKTIKGIKE